MITSSSIKKSCRGGALIAALLLVVITLLLATGYVDTLTTENKTVKDNEYSTLALYAADAAIQYALAYTRANPSTTNPLSSVNATLFSTGGISVKFSLDFPSGTTGSVSCSTLITSGTGDCLKYTATGRVEDSSGKTIAQRKVEAIIKIDTSKTPTEVNIEQWNEYYI